MESSKKGLNSSNDDMTETENMLLYKNLQISSTKKKFCNTVFAEKMRNRRKEDKIKNLDGTDVLTSCKQVSVDLTRLSAKAVPKLISTVEHRNRRRKRFQWRLGNLKKKKKARDKTEKKNKIDQKNGSIKETVIDKNVTQSDNMHVEERAANKNKFETDKLETSIDKDDTQRRKSMRHLTPITVFDDKWDVENKSNIGLASEEVFSCRRTEQFIGKLCTKEARILNIEKILNEESFPIGNHNNERDDKVNDSEKNNEINSQIKLHSVSETEKNEVVKNINNSKTVENKLNDTIKKSIEAKAHKSEEITKNTVTSQIILEEDVNNQDFKKLLKIDSENKEGVIIDESVCRRTIPFIGKHPRKLTLGVSERPIEIDCSNDTDMKLDSSTEQVNTKPDSLSTDKELKLNSCNKGNTKSEIYHDNNLKLPSLKNLNTKLNILTDINTKSDSSLNKITELNNSIKDPKSNMDSPLKEMENEESKKLPQNVIQQQSTEKYLNAKDIIMETTGKEIENVSALTDDIDSTLDTSINDANIQAVKNNVNNETKEIWSCRRTEPYLGKEYANCSRTLPFLPPLNKLKATDVLGTSTEVDTSQNIVQRRASSRLFSSEDNQSTENSKENINTDIPVNQENDVNNTDIDNDDNLIHKIDVPIQNGDWKFRRKRQQLSDNEAQEESKYSKKPKIKSSPDSKPSPEKLNPALLSPERTICTLFSLNCVKHTHHHTDNGQCAVSTKIKENAYVLLTKLEKMTDPLVVNYFKKIECTYSVKKLVVSPFTNKSITDEFSRSLDEEISDIPLSNNEEQSTSIDCNNKSNDCSNKSSTSPSKDVSDSQKLHNQNDNNSQNGTESSSSESKIGSNSRIRRRTLSEASTDSSIIIHPKRRKRPVNYVEDYSDSESDAAHSSRSSSMHMKMRSQSHGPVLRHRSRNKNVILDSDENDKEVEEFSYIGLRSQSRNNETDVCSDKDVIDTDNICDSKIKENQTLCKSPLEKEIKEIENSSKTPSLQLTSDQCEQLNLIQDANEQNKSNDKPVNQAKEENSSNSIQIRPQSTDPEADHCKTPSISEPRTELETEQIRILRTPTLNDEVSTDRMLSTPKTVSKTESIATSDGKARIYKTNELNDTPKKLATSPSRIDRAGSHSSNISDTPLRSTELIKNNLLDKLNKSGTNSEFLSNIHKTMNPDSLSDLKVQLIRLETICRDFEDYSASEIELLTRKYIDLLMNSNFTCDTWRTPINYHRSKHFVENHIEQVDNSDCISSDTESQDEIEESEHAEATGSSCITTEVIEYVVEETSGNNIMERTTSQCDDEPLTSLETAIATLVDGEIQEERNFGAVNISDALNVASINKEKEPVVLTVELSEEERRNENQDQPEKNQDELSKERCSSVLINGINMFGCRFCNKLFTSSQLFNNHMEADHNTNEHPVSTSSNTTPKSSEKPASKTGVSSSSKRQTATKGKRMSTCSDSLMCTICSVTFNSKELLFDHIMTHNEHELQEAYKHAKAKKKQQQLDGDHCQSVESEKEQDENHTAKPKRKSVDNNIRSSRSSIESNEVIAENGDTTSAVTTPVRSSLEQQKRTLDTLERGSVGTANQSEHLSCNRPITICPCHAHETTNQDLQIEMVLLCKICNVIFRRRDCFEVHFRTSLECRRRRTNNEVLKVPKLFCSGCPCMLDSLTDMRSHLEMHAKKNCHGTVTFICNICKVAFFGVGGIFYSHWFNHMKAPNFVASRYSFPKLSVVSVLEDANVAMATSKSQEGFFYIAEHVCRQCRLPFSSEPELQKHELTSCQPKQPNTARSEVPENNRLQMIKLICDLCKKYYVSKENFDRHCSERNHLKTPITKFSRLPINNNEQAFVCSLCRSISKSLDDMKEHWKRIHSPIMELYTCKTCNIVPSNDVANYTYEKFEQHCRSAHKSEVITCLVYFVTARYVCSICKFGFETEESMKEHQVVHEKQSSQISSINLQPLLPKMHPGLPSEPQTATLWVADKEVAADGGRQVHPVYVHYPGVHGNPSVQRQILPNNTPLNVNNQQQLQIRTPGQVNTSAVTNLNNSDIMLRQMLNQKQCDGPIQQQQSSSKTNDVETIFIDSRSNSPILEAITTAGTNDKTLTDNQETVANSVKKSYMTMVNPNFESMLGSNTNAQAATKNTNPLPHTNDSNSSEKTASLDTESLTPQPFEVVLVTDDLNENSNSETSIAQKESVVDSVTQNTSPIVNLNQQPSIEVKENASTKSLIRVRSIAELQCMEIHLCSTCGLSFDTLSALEQHRHQQHPTSPNVSNDVGRSTPVQMISPMISQGNKESLNDPQNFLTDQMKQKYSKLMNNSQASPNNTDLNTRVNSPLLSNQLQYRQSQQQQQQQSYWFASCNGTEKSPLPNTNYNYNINHQKQQQQTNIQRRVVNTNNDNSALSSLLRAPPPHYPQIPNPTAPVRSGAIQLPERNTAGNSIPTTKRPSGAATRIPQQSLPSFEELTQGVSPYWSYSMQGAPRAPGSSSPADVNQGGPPVNPRLMPSLVPRPPIQHQMPQKTYSRTSSGSPGGYPPPPPSAANPNYHQKATAAAYTCKMQGCGFRTDNPMLIRSHEKSHFAQPAHMQPPPPPPPLSSHHLQQQQQQHHHHHQQPQHHHQQQQQQRFAGMKHVPVSQMPERPRHAMPTIQQQHHQQRTPAAIPPANERRLICRICNYNCGTAGELLEHVTAVHGGITSGPPSSPAPTAAAAAHQPHSAGPPNRVCCYVCDYCLTPLLFESEELLRKHMNATHNFSCDVCSKRYPSKIDLMLHKEIHARST